MFDQEYFYITDYTLNTTSGTLSNKIDTEITTLSGNLQTDLETRALAGHTHPELEVGSGKFISMYSTASGIESTNRAVPWNVELIKDDIYTHDTDDYVITLISGGVYEVTYYTNWNNNVVDPNVVKTKVHKEPADSDISNSISYGYSPSSSYPHLTTGKSFTHEFNSNDSIQVRVEATEIDWYNEDWDYRKEIIIDYTQVAGNLTNFPVYIYLTGLTNVSHASGYDIIFTDADKNLLSHEIESFNSGTLHAWVKVPSLSSSEDTSLFIYYGNPSITTSQENITDVWSNGFVGVWHMNNNPAGTAPQLLDSTSNNNDGTSNGSMTSGDLVTGKLDQAINFDGSNDWFNVPNDTSLQMTNQLTLSAWVRSGAGGQTVDTMVVGKEVTGTYYYHLGIQSNDVANFRVDTVGDDSYLDGATTLAASTWYFIYGIYNNNDVRVYYNTTEDGTDTLTGDANIESNTQPVYIGKRYNDRYFNGDIDEVRISNVARTTSWMTTEYNNQNSPSNFYTVEAEQAAINYDISLIPNESNITIRLIRYN